MNLLSLVLKYVPIIDLGVISLNSKFQRYSSLNSWDKAFEKIQDGSFN